MVPPLGPSAPCRAPDGDTGHEARRGPKAPGWELAALPARNKVVNSGRK